MAAHAHELKDVIPLPDHTWKWSDTDLRGRSSATFAALD